MSRAALPTLSRSVVGKRILGDCPTVFAHNLLVNTGLKGLGGRARKILERLDLSASFAELAPPTEGPPRDSIIDGVRVYLKRTGKAPRRPVAPASVARNFEALRRLVGLEPSESQLLLFLVARQHDEELKEMADALPAAGFTGAVQVVAAATNLAPGLVRRAFLPSSRLVVSGLVSVSEGYSDVGSAFELKDGLTDLLLNPGLSTNRLLKRYFPPDRASALLWEDFAHLGEAPAIVAKLLRTSVAGHRRGTNVLFYGATGTGKTELARLVARRTGMRLHPAGRADDSGESASPRERLSSLLLGHRLLQKTPAVLLFDELEDLFQMEWMASRAMVGRQLGQLSKQWFNELLDNNPVPTLWISNSTEGVDPAFLRRFTYAVEFQPLGARQRVRALERHLGKRSPVQPEDVQALAERYEVSPAQLGSAVAAARSLSDDGEPDRATLEKLLAPTERLVLGRDTPHRPRFDAAAFRLDALNTREDLVGIAGALASWQPGAGPGVSLCLYGPPGTGKSEFAKHLAHRMGRRVVYRRVSDIQSMWVGEAEKNIARAFREAEMDNALLLFDEADSFLRDRRGAKNSWEVSQVNEFLQQLEAFRGVVVCTTNLWRDLDEASLRRFIFKVEFLFLKPGQAMALFASTLGPQLEHPLTAAETRGVEAELAALGSLTPGDFAAVARGFKALGRRMTAEQAVEHLRREVAVKQGAPRAIGIRST